MRSTVRSWALGILAVAAFAGAGLEARAQDAAAPTGDPARGARLAYTCLGCHGIANYKNAAPVYNVPRLRGQHADYLVIALQAYRNGERSHGTMHANASSLSDKDMADVAAYLSGAPLKPAGAPVGAPPPAAQVCVACHGNDGVGITPQYPTLSGQYESYIVRALTDYKKGGRKNPVMAGFAAQLTDADIKALAAYYSQQRPALDIVQKPAQTAAR
ncbi:MAG: c-type cytochrome [Steroidobacteraceae bacterium]|jgi:cytochrome c553|nr:c-type cytochrome [Steroidobacteraceae bacterium]